MSSASGGAVRLTWAGELWALLPQRALVCVPRRTVLIADPHFGKAATFRAAGVPVPEGGTAHDLVQLDAVLKATEAAHLVVLGDFFHAKSSRDPATLAAIEAWLQQRPELRRTLVRGNHDLHAGDPPAGWRFDCVAEESLGKIDLRHMPVDAPARAMIAGHVHPVARLQDPLVGRVRFPCFVVDERQVLLPAFGTFTGGHVVTPTRGMRVFPVTPGGVVEAVVR